MGPVAFQGEFGAFSELASREFFGHDIEVSPSQTFTEVFGKVAEGTAEAGIIPIENSLAGSIHENYDLLLEHSLWIIGEIKLRIVHHLIANPGVALDEVRRVMSHPQALAQCRDYLRNLPNVSVTPVYDTAGAARELKKTGARDSAAIASAQAAADYGLDVLAAGIESNHQNYTRFLAIAREPLQKMSGDPADMKVSLVFSLRHEPGALFKGIGVFALREIDLLKIESRPLFGSPWEYLFYLDFKGSLAEPRVRKALDHLGELTMMDRVLGCYRVGRVADGANLVKRAAHTTEAQP